MGGVVSAIGNVVGSVGGLISGDKAADASKGQAEALRAAGLRASEMAQFRPIGISTGFGTSRFTVNDLGQVTDAGYTLNPRLAALRGQFLRGAQSYDPNQVQQFVAPISQGVSSLFNLGQGYIAEDPTQAAQRYYAQQRELIAPGEEFTYNRIKSNLQRTGRGGLAVGQGGDLAAANPELQAFYNAIAQRDLQLATQSEQQAREQVRFGTGLLTGATELARQIPGLQSASYLPIETQLGLARTVEAMGQQPFQLSLDLARAQSGAGSAAGQLYMSPQAAAAQAYNQYQSYSPLGSFLGSIGPQISGGSFGNLFSNPNQYGGLFGGGKVPTSVNRSWGSME
jgi:hypothetical protein